MANAVDKMYIEMVKEITKNMSSYDDKELSSECLYYVEKAYEESKSILFKYYTWKLVNLALNKRNIPRLYFVKAMLYKNIRNKKKMIKCLEIADKKEVYDAHWFLAYEYAFGPTLEKNKELSIKYFDKIISKAEHYDLVQIARCFEKKGTIITDLNKAMELYKKSALMGNKVAITKVILYYNALVFDDDVENAEELVEEGEYSLNLEKSLETKWEETQEKIKKAKKEDIENLYYWSKVGADFKDKNAIFYLGYYNLIGMGCKKNDTQAFYYYKEAAELGCNSAYYMVGSFYFYGEVIDKNHEEALKWFLIANDSGLRLEKLGDIYYLDEGIKQDYNKAFTYYYRALDFKLPSTYYKIARCYEYGHGCDIDYIKAKEYYEMALEGGYLEAKEKLKNEKITIEV